MVNILAYKLFENNNDFYYNSYGTFSNIKKIQDIEVDDRHNYTKKEFKLWIKKYNIQPEQPVVWVTKTKKDVITYAEYNGGDGYYKINTNAGFLIEESDDGDGGYIMVITDPNPTFYYEKI